ncbi:nitroreductase [Paraburkholderia sp. MM6662-R1]|uniref:nitroreductase n=1 Tax=Paraburkholderia sp. MM6662-R1 TaxID=2991066 RepID=UPI003D1D30BF
MLINAAAAAMESEGEKMASLCTATVTADFTCLDELLRRRHSCRAFLPQPVSRDVIRRILETAQRTASWCNAQPWQVHVMSGEPLESLRSDLMARASANLAPSPELDWPREYRGVHQTRRRESGWALYRATGVQKGDREAAARQGRENFRLFGAPHLAIVCSDDSLGTHGVMDCGAWVSNFLLAATAVGVSAIAQAALASWPDILRKHLDIGAENRIICGISFGFEDTEHAANSFRTSRAPIDDVVAWVE